MRSPHPTLPSDPRPPHPASASSGVGAAHPDNGIGSPTSVHSVHGWLMSVPECHAQGTGACYPEQLAYTGAGLDSLSAGQRQRSGRSASITSLGSTDSAHLDDLIRNNCVARVDDETDLPTLADLDLDDSADDFWKMGEIHPEDWPPERDHELLSLSTPFSEQELAGMSANDDKLLSWTPEADVTAHSKLLSTKLCAPSSGYPVPPPPAGGHRFVRRQRSSSLSSENSLTSESTITTGGNTGQYAHYGMTPMLYPSESSASNTSRSPSRLSDYSATSSQASHTSGIPRPQSSSRAGATGGIPAAAAVATGGGPHHSSGRRLSDKLSNETLRSSSRIGTRISSGQSRLAKRATHVPLPSNHAAPPTVVATTSRSTGLSSSSNNNNTNTRPASRIGGLRSSHIPSPRTAGTTSPEPPSSTARSNTASPTRGGAYRPMSPFSPGNAARVSGLRSPTPTGALGFSSAGAVNSKKEESRIARPPTAAAPAAASKPAAPRAPTTAAGSATSRLAKPRKRAA